MPRRCTNPSARLCSGNAYAFKELADRAYARLKEKVEVDVGPYRHMSDEDLQARIEELQRQLGVAGENSKPN